MLLYHAIRKTYDDFEEVYHYYLDDEYGKLKPIESWNLDKLLF